MINMENREELLKEIMSEAWNKPNSLDACLSVALYLLDEIEMLKFQLKAADSVNEQLQFQYNELEKAMYKLTISNDNN